MNDKDVLKRLEGLGQEVMSQIDRGDNPFYEVAVRNLSNVSYDEDKGLILMGDKTSRRKFLNIAHARKFMQTMLVTAEIKKLINSKATTSIRDLYYALKHTIGNTQENTFEEQEESNPIIVDLEATLDLLREELHLNASSNGAIVGEMKIKDSGDTINLAKMGSGGWNVPSNVEPEKIEIKEVDADFVLQIEKDAVWQRFNEDRFWKKHRCLIVTGKGQASRGVRRLINRLNTEFKLPVYCLNDADPWGMYIYSVIKQGSISLSFSSNKLATPKAKYIGLTTKDVDTFKLPNNVTIRLNQQDLKRITEMKNYIWFKDKLWQEELERMRKKNYKLELEALSAKNIRFITEEYLPRKIETNDFLP